MTSFRIAGLSAHQFQNLFHLKDEQLAIFGVNRCIADEKPDFPDRIELRDAEPEALLLLNHVHQPADAPYRASYAIFVREGATKTFDRVNEVPEVLRGRLLSLRAFDRAHMMVDADTVDGDKVEDLIPRFLANDEVAYVQAISQKGVATRHASSGRRCPLRPVRDRALAHIQVERPCNDDEAQTQHADPGQ